MLLVGDGFADYAAVSLHCLRVYLEKSYWVSLDLLSEMPQILGEIGLEAADLSQHSTLVKWFDRIKTALWRMLLRLSSELHEPSGHAAIDATFFSPIKRTLGDTVRARTWYGEFRELVLMCVIHNIKQTVNE